MKIREILLTLLLALIIAGCDGGGKHSITDIGGEDDPTEDTQKPPTTGGEEDTGDSDNPSGDTQTPPTTGDEDGEAGANPLNKNANIGGEKYAYRIEMPRLNDDDYFLTRTTTVNGKENITYSISFNAERQHSRWVAFTFDGSNRSKTVGRSDNFQPDPDFLGEYAMTSQQINKNGYQRGHLVASYDRVYSREANEQTFYMSNMSPQIGRFNTGIWNDLEYKINEESRGWGCNPNFADTLYVVKGGTIAEGQYTSKGTCPTVPSYYFMALLRLKNKNYSGIAFCFEHKSYHSGTVASYALTIDELEEFTGIDFFCNLNDKLENAVESTISKDVWGL